MTTKFNANDAAMFGLSRLRSVAMSSIASRAERNRLKLSNTTAIHVFRIMARLTVQTALWLMVGFIFLVIVFAVTPIALLSAIFGLFTKTRDLSQGSDKVKNKERATNG